MALHRRGDGLGDAVDADAAAALQADAGRDGPFRPFLAVVLVQQGDAVELAVAMLQVEPREQDRRADGAQPHLAQQPPVLARKGRVVIDDGHVVGVPVDLIGRDRLVDNEVRDVAAFGIVDDGAAEPGHPERGGQRHGKRRGLLRTLDVARGHRRLGQLAEADRHRFGEIRPAPREGQVTPGLLEQRHARQVGQLAQLKRDGARAEIEFGRGGAHAAQPGDRFEGGQEMQERKPLGHGSPFR